MSRLENHRAASIVELAISIPIFVTLIFAAIDSSRLFFTYLTLEQAVRKAGRYGVTGQRLFIAGQQLSREDSIIEILKKNAHTVALDSDSICIQPLEAECVGSPNAGSSGQFFKISVEKTMVFTPLFGAFANFQEYKLRIGATFRNETF